MKNGRHPVLEHLLLAQRHQQYVSPTLAGITRDYFGLTQKDISAKFHKLPKGIADSDDRDENEDYLLYHRACISGFEIRNSEPGIRNSKFIAILAKSFDIMKLLDQQQIRQKIKRLAIEIIEENYNEEGIVLAGINNNGWGFAQMLWKELEQVSPIPVTLTRIRLNPAKPTEKEVEVEMPLEKLKNKVIIIVDDVANTGRTIFYACSPLFKIIPRKVEVAVLVDRKHKSFPVRVDYVGLSLATTLQENIEVHILSENEQAVYLS
jgi:pyrimidine operon attenuation protein/uracil phosphoribosyltransferase